MPDLIYDHENLRMDLGFGAPPILREPPQYVGPPQHWSDNGDPHVLRVAVPLSGHGLNTRINRSALVQTIGQRLMITSILRGFDFYRSWVLLHGPLSAFEGAGIIALDRHRGNGVGPPTVVAGPAIFSQGRRTRGDSSYSSPIMAAMAVVGAQLYLCEKVRSGTRLGRSRDEDIGHLTQILRPLRAHLRKQSHGAVFRSDEERIANGSTGFDDPLYKSLLARGSPLVQELYADRLTKAEIGRRWANIGAQLPPDAAADSSIPKAIIEAESALRVAVDMACAAFQRERAGRALRFEGASASEGSQVFSFGQSDAETLFENGLSGGRVPDIFALTRLAWLWDINPSDFYGGVFAWRLHFAAARYLGNMHFSAEEVHIDTQAHWGLRAMRHDIFDTMLDVSTAAARAWMRPFMVFDDSFWEAVPPALGHAVGVSPAWRFRRPRARKGPP